MAVVKVKPKIGRVPSVANSSTPMSSPTPSCPSSYATIEEVWDVVGADNIHELTVDQVVLQDKMSMFLYGLFLKDDKDNISRLLQEIPTPPPPLAKDTSYKPVQADEVYNPFKENTKASSLSAQTDNDDKPIIKIESPIDQSSGLCKSMSEFYKRCKPYILSSNYLYSGFCRGVYYHRDYNFEQDRYDAFGINTTAYSPYKLPNVYRIVPLSPQSIARNSNNLFYFARNLDDYISKLYNMLSGFPNRSLNNGSYMQFPILEHPFFRMQFFFRGRTPEESMMVAKYIGFSQGADGVLYPYKHYLPVLFLRDNVSKDVYSVFAALPGKDKYLPLYNPYGLDRIKKAESVVICGTLEDADAMQRYDERNSKYAYVAFVCDQKDSDQQSWDQVDFSPIKGKKVEFLISNHSGRSIEEERIRIHGLYQYLKRLQKPRIQEFCFRERFVQYPADVVQNYGDYYNVFYQQRSTVVSKETYSEEEFRLLLASPNGEIPTRNVAEKVETGLKEKPDDCKQKSPQKQSGRPKHLNLTAEKTILRPFIRRGCTTVLVGDPGIGKSRFAIALAAQVAGSKSEFLKDRLWTRCLSSDGEKTGYKVVYWVFDDVDQDDIQLQRNFFARGLSSDQNKNLFIDPARSMRKRDCETLKAELEKYTSQPQGTPDHPVDFLIIDTLLSFARSPVKIFSAFEELVRLKDELPGLAILVLHHNSKEGNPYGGILATNMPRVIIEMKRDNSSLLDDLEVPITINVIKHSNEHAGIDIIPFDIKLDDDHFVVTNNSDLPLEMVQKLVIHEYKNNRLESYSNTDIGRLLGVGRKPIETIWKKDGTKEEAQTLWDRLKEEFREKEKAKALNASSSKKRRKKARGRGSSRIEDEEREEDDDNEDEYPSSDD